MFGIGDLTIANDSYIKNTLWSLLLIKKQRYYKVGDRVALYHNGHRIVGKVSAYDPHTKFVHMQADDDRKFYGGHAKQYRKLKPKYITHLEKYTYENHSKVS